MSYILKTVKGLFGESQMNIKESSDLPSYIFPSMIVYNYVCLVNTCIISYI